MRSVGIFLIVELLKTREDGQQSYYLQDELGSPIRLANQNGELQDSLKCYNKVVTGVANKI